MNRTSQKLVTCQNLFDLPGHISCEVVHGQLVTRLHPTPAGSIIGMSMGVLYDQKHRGPGVCWILVEPVRHLHQNNTKAHRIKLRFNRVTSQANSN